jgi:serine/threonine protein phosphatase PrpC
MKVRAMTTFSSPGTRMAQEDFILSSPERGIFVVADGFGGPTAGQEASRSVCEAVRAFLEKEAGDEDATLPFVLRKYYSLAANVLFNAVVHANRKVLLENRRKNVHEKGGASLIGGYLDSSHVALASVGGCAAYLLRNGTCSRLTTPRTYLQSVDPSGHLAAEHATRLDHPLTALGITDDLEPEIYEFQAREGDVLVLTSSPRTWEKQIVPQILEPLGSGKKPGELAELGLSVLKGLPADDNASYSLVFF